MAFSLAAVAVLPVQAQADVLVSNLLQPIHTSGTTSIGISTLFPQRILQQHSAAQTFTTADAADGYTLSSVELYVKNSPDTDALRVSIYNADEDGNPGTSIQVLGSPTTISETNLNTFTAPADTFLSKETTYFVVVEATSDTLARGIAIGLGIALGQGTDSGGASGWSVGSQRTRTTNAGSTDTGNWDRINGTSLRFRVNGARSTDNATLDNLTLSHGTLSPEFASTTEMYSATVNVSRITVTPTKSTGNATVVYLDGNDAVIADADSTTAGHQIDLSVGVNTVKVKVTAEDTVTTKTYTLSLTLSLPSLTIADADATEGSDVSFTVTLSVASAKTVGVTWTASAGGVSDTADTGDLAGPLTGTLTFSPGDTSKTFTV